jgi:hypothetical protein
LQGVVGRRSRIGNRAHAGYEMKKLRRD